MNLPIKNYSLGRSFVVFLSFLILIAGITLVTVAQTPAPTGMFRFPLAGDSIIERRISVFDDPGFLQMINHIRNADAAFTNFEMLIHNFEAPGPAMSGGEIHAGLSFCTGRTEMGRVSALWSSEQSRL